jgi:hypothetical protein
MELLSEFRDMIGQPFRDPDGKINTPVKGIAPDDKVHSGKKGGFIEIGVNHDGKDYNWDKLRFGFRVKSS